MEKIGRQAGFFLLINIVCLLITASGKRETKKTFTLIECLETVKTGNPRIHLQQSCIETERTRLAGSRLDFIPEIYAGSLLEYSTAKAEKRLSLNLNLELSLKNTLKNIYLVRQRQSETQTAALQKEAMLIQLQIETLRNYIRILTYEQILKASEENFRSGAEQLRLTEKLVENGIQTQNTLLEIQAQHSAEKAELIDTRTTLENSRIDLLELLGEDLDLDFELDDSLPFHPDRIPTIEELYPSVLHLPQRRILDRELETHRYRLGVLRSDLLPDLKIQLGYGSFSQDRHPFSIRNLYYNQYFTTLLQLEIPLSDLGSRQTAVKVAGIQEKSLKKKIGIAEREIEKELRQFLNRTLARKEHYHAAEEHRKAAEESFRYVTELFNLGMLNGTDFVTARSGLLKSDSDYYVAKYELIFSLLVIDFLKLTTFADEKNMTL